MIAMQLLNLASTTLYPGTTLTRLITHVWITDEDEDISNTANQGAAKPTSEQKDNDEDMESESGEYILYPGTRPNKLIIL